MKAEVTLLEMIRLNSMSGIVLTLTQKRSILN